MAEKKNHWESFVRKESFVLFSDFLDKEISLTAYYSIKDILGSNTSLLLVNDGQDLVKMEFEKILATLYAQKKIGSILCIGVHCTADRNREYGVAYRADFKGWGNLAGVYTKFIMDELLPYIRKRFEVYSFKEKAFAGFSLGGLSALDIVWNHASEFTKVGMFSPSLWWRRKDIKDDYDEERDRLMHLQIRKGVISPWLQFYIECGKLDENGDRNSNFIIDSIDDALDLIIELKAKGYTDKNITYVELEYGRHDIPTWASILPDFLQWGWGY